MKNLFLRVTMTLLLAALLVFGAAAATVYVADGATGTGESAENPIGSFSRALDLLQQQGGTVVLVGPVYVRSDMTVPEQTADLTITAEGSGRLVMTGDVLTFAKNRNTNQITMDVPLTTGEDGIYLFGGFNSIHFTKNFAVDGFVRFYGGVQAPLASTADSYEVDPDANLAVLTDLPYSITVDNGEFRSFHGGNYRYTTSCYIGAIAAPLTVTINGGTFTRDLPFSVNSAIKNAYMFSLSGHTLLADDATLTINGGTFDMPIYVHGYIGPTGSKSTTSSVLTYSDVKYYAADGDVLIDINGGTFTKQCIEISAEQTAASYNRLHRGDFTLDIDAAATFADGTTLDATQVKAYAGKTESATLICPADHTFHVKRFDTVNGAAQTYTEPLRIACIGDSITEGVGASDYSIRSYPARLLAKIVKEDKTGEDVILSNYGNSGAKTVDYEGRWYNHSLAYVLSMQETDADYVLIGLGTNDARMTTYTYGYADRFYDDYTALLRGYGELPSTKVVFNTSAIYRKDKRDIATVSNIHPMQREIAETLNAKAVADGKAVRYTFVDLYALTLEDFMKTSNMNDSVHPNSAGYIIYANAIYDALFNGKTEVEGFKTSGDLWVSADGTNTIACTEENPTSNLSVAFSRAADGATVHIVGEFAFANMENKAWGFCTPYGIKDFSIVGEGEGAKLTIDSDMFFVKGDLYMDNITFGTMRPTNKYAPLHICLGYNNVTFGENFKTLAPDGTQGGALLIAGVVTLGDDFYNTGWYNSRKSVCFDRDCTVNILGGDYVGYVGGNYLFASYASTGVTNPRPSLYGTYSGDMTVTLGSGITIAENAANGVSGQNYLTGSITLHAGAWANDDIRTFGYLGSVPEQYEISKNTGTVTVKVADTCTATVRELGDLDASGAVDVKDVLTMLRHCLNGTEIDSTNYYNGLSAFGLQHILHMVKLAAK